MNIRSVFYTVGQALLLEAGFLLLPLALSLADHDCCLPAFLLAVFAACIPGLLFCLLSRPDSRKLYDRDGFCIVGLVWIFLSAVGALPFVLSGAIPSYIDALFETVSGFTTTGASILTDVESLSRSLLFWRSFTHWLGGMGILVFVVMLGKRSSGNSMQILRAEMPGPVVGKLVPKAKETAHVLYRIYFVMTLLEILFLLLGGMPLFDSVVHALGTAGTGGYGIRADSLASYSPFCQWTVCIFMLLFGINFNLYFFILIRRGREAFRNEEFLAYLLIVCAATGMVFLNIRSGISSGSEALRQAAFQVSSVVTTTGYSTVDFDLWPGFSKAVLLLLMFFGGCAGSTAGGFKISRIVILFRALRNELRRLLRPRSVSSIRLGGQPVSEETIRATAMYLAIYVLMFCLIFLLVSLEPFDLETGFSAAFSCFNNVGPGFSMVGPAASYALYSPFSKLVLTFAMLLGRLEIYPLLLCFAPSTWILPRKPKR